MSTEQNTDASTDEKELRLLSVTATVSPHANEEELAETVQEVLRESDIGDAVDFGTVDVYQHNAHSGSPYEETGEQQSIAVGEGAE
jgi:hypothetical protein